MGRTNRKLLEDQPNCENVIDLAAERDPTRGISWAGNGTKNGSERNDRLNGQHGSNKLYGHGGDDVLWGDAAHDSGGARARRQKDMLYGGSGDDTLYGGRGTNTIDGRRRQRLPPGQRRPTPIFGGNGNDTHPRSPGQRDTRSTPAPATTRSPRSPPAAAARVTCGPGDDTVIVSRFTGNAAAGRCEVAKKGWRGEGGLGGVLCWGGWCEDDLQACSRPLEASSSQESASSAPPEPGRPHRHEPSVTAHTVQQGADASGRQARGCRHQQAQREQHDAAPRSPAPAPATSERGTSSRAGAPTEPVHALRRDRGGVEREQRCRERRRPAVAHHRLVRGELGQRLLAPLSAPSEYASPIARATRIRSGSRRAAWWPRARRRRPARLPEALERARETYTRGRSRPAQNASGRAPGTIEHAPARDLALLEHASAPRSGVCGYAAPDRAQRAHQRDRSNSASEISSTPRTWTSPRGSASSAATSTSPWKRTASNANTSASRNAVAPNAATANSARRRSVTVGQPAELLQPLRVEPPMWRAKWASARSPKSSTSAATSASARDWKYSSRDTRARRRPGGRRAAAPAGPWRPAASSPSAASCTRHLPAARVQRLLNFPDRRLGARPDLLHDLGFQSVSGGEGCA